MLHDPIHLRIIAALVAITAACVNVIAFGILGEMISLSVDSIKMFMMKGEVAKDDFCLPCSPLEIETNIHH
jgi:hypothetical protein